ncbi:hypothetical protein [Thermomonas sp.]|uniref:hypothetical protein n=1 Tax=Thermomonas sp. TaxID=1971895 RepID=UPI00248910C8|nr:hypothetical protein [Thermomonas sp.]MDI1252669.1 hypothetical protein [Thermomonas sp.]
MNMARVVQPEWLDHLPADDPRAIRSRDDLRRINVLMSATRLLGEALDPLIAGRNHARIVELGAGDGSLLLRLARSRANAWPPVTLDLLDMQPIVAPATLARYGELGWAANVVHADVFDWLRDTPTNSNADVNTDEAPIIVANLFLHHFEGQHLSELLHGIAARARAFICVEPRRSSFALLGSRLLGVIGCNAVTRHDAVVSVRAGFADQDLSQGWPSDAAWDLREHAAGLFGHRLVAVRT